MLVEKRCWTLFNAFFLSVMASKKSNHDETDILHSIFHFLWIGRSVGAHYQFVLTKSLYIYAWVALVYQDFQKGFVQCLLEVHWFFYFPFICFLPIQTIFPRLINKYVLHFSSQFGFSRTIFRVSAFQWLHLIEVHFFEKTIRGWLPLMSCTLLRHHYNSWVFATIDD